MASSHHTSTANLAAPGTIASANEEFFSNSGESILNQQWVKDVQTIMKQQLEDNIDWLGIDTSDGPDRKKMLDYACGMGFLSVVSATLFLLTYTTTTIPIPPTNPSLSVFKTQVFHPFFSKCIGIDIAPGMIKAYSRTAANLGLALERMYAVHADLSNPNHTHAPAGGAGGVDLSSEEFSNFDFAGVALALHHMEHPQEAVSRIVERLRPGGVFLAIDRPAASGQGGGESGGDEGHAHGHGHGHGGHGGHSHSHGNDDDDRIDPNHPAAHTISHTHASFSREQVERMFADAGLVDVELLYFDYRGEVAGLPRGLGRLFFARGRKAG
ncbi:hypothetical protein FQN50_008101 [Emmonsiellopsis sp. PD_5]|nr:hypothetical protein FQN50_008101 [Emmonsiellopsis sp. PD_5]